jgi:hypothetical protein
MIAVILLLLAGAGRFSVDAIVFSRTPGRIPGRV